MQAGHGGQVRQEQQHGYEEDDECMRGARLGGAEHHIIPLGKQRVGEHMAADGGDVQLVHPTDGTYTPPMWSNYIERGLVSEQISWSR